MIVSLMKWINFKGKLHNAEQITTIERIPGSDAVVVMFSDGHYIDISALEFERLLEFCGAEQIEIQERQKK